MLVLTRKVGERINIDGTVEIAVAHASRYDATIKVIRGEDTWDLRGSAGDSWDLSLLSPNCPLTETVTVEISKIDRGQIKLGFKAPEAVQIWRQEVYEQRN